MPTELIRTWFAGLTATASVVNSGIINVGAAATAFATDDNADGDYAPNYAGAIAGATGIEQDAEAGATTRRSASLLSLSS